MSYLDELDTALAEQAKGSDKQLRRVLMLFRRVLGQSEDWRQKAIGVAVAVDERLDVLDEKAAAGAARLLAVEVPDPLRLTVVANVGLLPASAAVTHWFRVTGDPAVYVGNGGGQPLRKIATAAL